MCKELNFSAIRNISEVQLATCEINGTAPAALALHNISGAFYPWAWSAPCPDYTGGHGVTYLACGRNGRYGLLETMSYDPVPSSTNCEGSVCNVAKVFGIVFPAVVGMMEGANLSGDRRCNGCNGWWSV